MSFSRGRRTDDVFCRIESGVKNSTTRNSVFIARTGHSSTGIRISGAGKTLELKRMMFHRVTFDGFSRDVQVGNDVLIKDTIRIINSDFGGAENELDRAQS